MNIKQAVVVRKDLQMSPGLLAAQVAHISAQHLITQIESVAREQSGPEKLWNRTPKLVVLGVNTLEELREVETKVIALHLPFYGWFDTIPSQIFVKRFFFVPVGISIGPADEESLKLATAELPLL